jgi:hypothetical protein
VTTCTLRLCRKSSAKSRRFERIYVCTYCLLKSRPKLQIRIMQLARERSPPPGLRLLQAKLSRNSNQIARGRIRRFESYHPSHAVGSLWAYLAMGGPLSPCGPTSRERCP